EARARRPRNPPDRARSCRLPPASRRSRALARAARPRTARSSRTLAEQLSDRADQIVAIQPAPRVDFFDAKDQQLWVRFILHVDSRRCAAVRACRQRLLVAAAT